MEKTFESILRELVSEYEKNSRIPVDEFIASKLKEYGTTEEGINEIKQASALIDKFDENAKSLSEARMSGKTRGDWMFEKLTDTLAPLSDDNAVEVLNAIDNSSNSRTNDLLNQ